jgi:hypothetical protein
MAPSRSRLRSPDPATQSNSAADTPMTDDMESNDNVCGRINRDGEDDDSSLAVRYMVFSDVTTYML